MIKPVLITLFLCQLTPAFSQNWIWADHTVKGSGNNYALDVSIDRNNNSYITGRVKSTATFGTGTGGIVLTPSGDRDIYVSKYRDDGTFVWAKVMGGTLSDYGYGIDNDSLGNIYITGHFTNAATFQSISLTSYGSSDFYIAKLDTLGNIIWVTQAGGTSAVGGYDIKTMNNGESVVTGSFFGTAVFGADTLVSNGLDDIFVAKYDSSGNCLWAVSFGGIDNDVGFGIDEDMNGNIYLTGYFTATVSFGAVILSSTSAGNSDIVTAKLDGNGTVIWAKKAGGGVADRGNKIKTDNLGNVHVAGNWAQTSAVILKYSSTGNLIWQRTQGGPNFDTANDLDVDDDYNVYVTGYFSETANFSGISLTAASTTDDIFIEKFDSAGIIQWARKQGGNANDHSFGLKLNSKNEILVSGAFEGTADFDGTTFTSFAVFDAFLAKLSLPLESVFSSNDTMICPGNQIFFTNNSIGYTTNLSWSFPGGIPSASSLSNPVVEYSSAGSYDVTLIISNGITSDTATYIDFITVQPFTLPDLGNDTSICSLSSYQLDAGVFNSYNWNTEDTTRYLTPSVTQIYSVTVTNAAGCSGTDSVLISIVNTLQPDLGNDTIICEGDTVLLDAGAGFLSYSWSTGETGSVIEATNDTLYSVNVTDTNGCTTADTLQLIYFTLSSGFLGADTMACPGNSVTLIPQINLTAVLWSTSETSFAINVLLPGDYSVMGSDSNQCTVADTVNINFFPSQNLYIGNDTSVCSGSPVSFDAGNNFILYGWSDSSVTQGITVFSGGWYWINAEDSTGCMYNDSAYVTELPLPLIGLGADTTICDSVILILDAGVGFNAYLWSDASTGQQLSVNTADVYFVTVTDSNLCSASDTIQVLTETCMGMNELIGIAELSVFPNPADDHVMINSDTGELSYEVITSSGQIILSGNYRTSPVQVDISELPDGIYFFRIIFSDLFIMKKIIVSKQNR